VAKQHKKMAKNKFCNLKNPKETWENEHKPDFIMYEK
jgi:hypothetical protein